MKQYKIVVEKHVDDYVAYPLGIKEPSLLDRGIPMKKPCQMLSLQFVTLSKTLETKTLILNRPFLRHLLPKPGFKLNA